MLAMLEDRRGTKDMGNTDRAAGESSTLGHIRSQGRRKLWVEKVNSVAPAAERKGKDGDNEQSL